jgi:peptidoglycan/LPS O-acetylase OafA/YrhL
MNIFRLEAIKARLSLPLHAMRGIAALIIFACHVTNRVKIASYGNDYRDSFPFNIYAAVTFFFVLSGFVLAISLAKTDLTLESYISFGVHRIFKIMPLMIVTVTIGGMYLLFIDPYMPLASLPDWYGPLTPLKFISAYVGYSLKPNPPIWTIFIELVGCALLPFMVATGSSKNMVIASSAALLLFGACNLGLHNDWNIYLIVIFVGVTILWWGRPFAERMMRLNTRIFWLLFAVLLAVFYMPRVVLNGDWHDPRFSLIETAAIAPLIAIAFFCPERFIWLEAFPFRFLGKISFSLYLTHWFFIMAGTNMLVMLLPSIADHAQPVTVAMISAVMLAIMLPLCLVIAALSYRYIEQPGQQTGRAVIASLRYRLRRNKKWRAPAFKRT